MRIAHLILLAVALAAGPRTAEAQSTSSSAESVQSLQQELAGLQQELAKAEAKALQDPAIAAEAKEVDEQVRAALKRQDPGFEKKLQRLEQIAKEMESKQAANAPEGELMPLVAEGQSIQRELEAVHGKVLESPKIKRRLDAFRDRVQARMTEIDPETPKRVKRVEAILRELQSRSSKPGS